MDAFVTLEKHKKCNAPGCEIQSVGTALVTPVASLNVWLKLVTRGVLLNNPDGIPVNPVQYANVFEKFVTLVLLSNNPAGIEPVKPVHP